MAAGLALLVAPQGLLESDSAGTAAVSGDPASEQAREVAQELGFNLDAHRAKPVSPGLLEWADVVLTMTEMHRVTLQVRFPEQAHKVCSLGAWANKDISDPYGQDVSVYRKTAAEIESALVKWWQEAGSMGKPEDSLF
jgi:protein-tyrosine-phosphatase